MNYKTAVILCGGKGTRLGELGKKLPKTLVKVQNKPIIWYILKSLKKEPPGKNGIKLIATKVKAPI